MITQTVMWVLFSLAITTLLVLDLVVFNKKPHEITLKEAIGWSIFWTVIGLLFNLGVYFWHGPKAGTEFLTGYLLERALSIDNLFVFVMIFNYFRVPAAYQHKVLFWGIVGALVMRALFIFTGVALLNRFAWMMYVFGAFLIYTGVKMLFQKEEDEIDHEKSVVLKLIKKFFLVTKDYHEDKFLVRGHFEEDNFVVKEHGRWAITPLLLVLLVVEASDVIFALDSIPAILSITRDTFLIYSSNIFAILGLRALYFAIAEFMKMFHHLKYGLSVILSFIGLKMLAHDALHVPVSVTLVVIVVVLAASVAASYIWPEKEEGQIKAQN